MEPIEFFTIVGSAAAVLGILIAWMTRRFNKIDDHVSEAHKRIDATNLRIDTVFMAINQRLDANQSIMIRMLEKQGK